MERNAASDARAELASRLGELERVLSERQRPEGAEAVAPVRIACRHGCGWTSEAASEAQARRAERAHVGHRHKEESRR